MKTKPKKRKIHGLCALTSGIMLLEKMLFVVVVLVVFSAESNPFRSKWTDPKVPQMRPFQKISLRKVR